MVEYIDQQIQSLSWQVTGKTTDITGANTCGDSIISGSDVAISIWQFHDRSIGSYDQLPIVESAREKIPCKAVRSHLISDRAFTALSNGSVLIHELVSERNGLKTMKQLAKVEDLHKPYKCKDMLPIPQSNSVITCGDDGGIATFNIDRPDKVKHKIYSDASLKCMDSINPDEIICGTMNGCLRHYDLRTGECVGWYSSQSLSTLLCVQRNPHVNHLAIGGNDQGSIILYDLRSDKTALAEISAHSAAVTNIRYRPRDPNIIYSSSLDGDLFRWILSTQFLVSHVPKKVESIGCTNDPLSITNFDVNDMGDIIYTSDHGAIFYRKMNEAGA